MAGFVGSDQFTYRAGDGAATSNVAQVSITVQRPNHAPVAAADSYSTEEDQATAVATPGVLANDSDEDADPLRPVLVSGPAYGALSLAADGSFVYMPAANFNGADSFSYRAVDDLGASSEVVTVRIDVIPVPDAPVAAADAYTQRDDEPPKVMAELHRKLGLCQARAGKLGDAERTLADAVASGNATGEVWMRLGEVRIAMGKLDEAIAALSSALEATDSNAQAMIHFLLAEAYDRARRPGDALAEAAEGLKQDHPLTVLHNPVIPLLNTIIREIRGLRAQLGTLTNRLDDEARRKD